MKTNGKIQLFPFLRVVLMLIAGIIVGDMLSDILPSIMYLIVLIVTIVPLCFIRMRPVTETCLILFSFFVLGIWLVELSEDDLEIRLPKGDVMYESILTSQPVEKGKVLRCDMMITKCEGLVFRHPFRVKATILRDTLDNRYRNLRVGDGIVACSSLSVPKNYSQSSNFDYRRWLQVHGFVAQTFVFFNQWEKVAINISSVSKLERIKIKALAFRQKMVERYKRSGIDGQQYAILSAMTLGDKSQITNEMNDFYSISGASHILALSGLHLGIIYAMLMMFFPRHRWKMLSRCFSLVCIWTYVVLVGMAPSVLRSAAMITVYAVVSVGNRERMSVNTLSLAAFIMLLFNPLNLWDVGFQMSFIAVLSIFIFYDKLYHIMSSRILSSSLIVRWIWGMTAVSVSAQIGTFPLVMFYFGRFSCYFLVTNFFVIPAATVILYSAFLMFLCSPFIIIQKYVAILLAEVVRWMNIGVMSIASLPYASIENIKINKVQLILIYILIFCAYYICHYVRKMYLISRV